MASKEVELVKITKVVDPNDAVTTDVLAVDAPTTGEGSHVLKPGTKIRPEITEEEAARLAERLYGITTSEICPLVSYDDRNFLIHVDR